MKRIVFLLFLVLINAQVVFATEILTNGGFESGFAGWVPINQGGFWLLDNNNLTPISNHLSAGPAAGNIYAVTDQSSPGRQALFQPFTISGPASSVILSFDMFVNNWATVTTDGSAGLNTGVVPNQHGRVDILSGIANPFDTGAGVLDNFYLGADLGVNPHQYTSYQFDITSLVGSGGTFFLRFAEVSNISFFNMGVDNVSIQLSANGGPEPIPEPSTLLLLGAGLAGVAFLRRRTKK